MAHFDPDEQIILAVDASHYGLSAILSHRYKDGTERPIALASKRIPKTELNRAINDKEASAIVFGFMKFYDYVYGRKIILRTDHEPLETIFGPKRGIPVTAASRLLLSERRGRAGRDGPGCARGTYPKVEGPTYLGG